MQAIVNPQTLIRFLAPGVSNICPPVISGRFSERISVRRDGGLLRSRTKVGKCSSSTGSGISPIHVALAVRVVFEMPPANREISFGMMWNCEPSGKSMTTWNSMWDMTIGLRAVISIDLRQARDCRQEKTNILTTSTSSQSSEFKNCFFGFFMDTAGEGKRLEFPSFVRRGNGR